jgi:hypothetical protein
MGLSFSRADNLVRTIKRDMNDGSGPLGFGQKGLDAKEIRSITKALSNMSAKDADKVIDKLDKMGLLGKFAREVMESPDLKKGGMSASDRGALFATLARSLDGASMASLTNAFVDNGRSFSQIVDYAGEISRAISTHASLQQQIDFVEASGANNTSTGYDAPMVMSKSDNVITVVGKKPPKYTYTDANLYIGNKPRPKDVAQGGIGNCYFLAGLMAMAKQQPSAIKNAIDYNPATKNFEVTFYPSGVKKTVVVTQAELKDNIQRGGGGIVDNTGGRSPIWASVMETAFAKSRDSNPKDGLDQGYNAIGAGGYGSEGLYNLTGSLVRNERVAGLNNSQQNDLALTIQKAIIKGQPITLSVASETTGKPQDHLRDNHAYSVEAVYRDAKGQWLVDLRNPWGHNKNIGEGANSNNANIGVSLNRLADARASTWFHIGQ